MGGASGQQASITLMGLATEPWVGIQMTWALGTGR